MLMEAKQMYVSQKLRDKAETVCRRWDTRKKVKVIKS